MELLWDFYRKLTDDGEELGGCIHYYNEESQSFYLLDGTIKTRESIAPKGHWDLFEPEDEAKGISDDIYTKLSFDHVNNGQLYGIGSDNNTLYFMRYVYAMDISDLYDNGQWQEQMDNQVKSLSLNIKNINADTFTNENSLFNPGAKLTLEMSFGDSDLYDIGVAYLDDIDYDGYSNTVPLSGRNSIGFFLSEQTFDDNNIYSGGRSATFSSILQLAGIDNHYIQSDDTIINVEFSPDTSILKGLNDTLKAIEWRMLELADGYIVIGDEKYLGQHNANGRYVFNGGTEAFKRKTSKNADAAFSRVCVKNKDNVCIYRSVPCWEYWQIGPKKTKYYSAPDGYSITDMESMADNLVSQLQYVGIGEEFSSPIRPQLQVGDIAEIFYQGDTESTSLGIITRVSHSFGSGGFRTDFSLDSGGSATDAEDYTMTKTAVLNGYNRKQRVIDFMGIVADKKIESVYSGGGKAPRESVFPELLSTSPVSIMRIM